MCAIIRVQLVLDTTVSLVSMLMHLARAGSSHYNTCTLLSQATLFLSIVTLVRPQDWENIQLHLLSGEFWLQLSCYVGCTFLDLIGHSV